jgi:hypothetical protein
LALHPKAGGLEFNEESRAISDCQDVGFGRPLNRVRDLSPGPHGQEPKTFRFQLEVDYLFLCEKATNICSRSRGAGPYQATVDRFMNRSKGQTGHRGSLCRCVSVHALILLQAEENYLVESALMVRYVIRGQIGIV